MSHRNTLAIVVVAALALLMGGAAVSQQPAPPKAEPDLATTLTELNRSVKEIASLLRQHLEKQDADLLMKRMEISARHLAQQEQVLRSAVAERDSLTDAMRELQVRADQMRAEMDEAPAVGAQNRNEEMERLKSEFELRQGLLKEKLAVADRKVMEMENDVAQFRDEIRAWQELVDARLGLR